MPVRLQEVHPSLVHFPIALLPIALASDALGALSNSDSLLGTGRRLMPLTAISAAVAAATGLVAQEEVNADGRAHDLLVTHRNLNVGLLALITGLAVLRRKSPRPSLGYLVAGFVGVAGMTYTAYLGGKMVYAHGVGVEPAGGVREGHAPPLTARRAKDVVRHAVDDLMHGSRHAVEHLTQGELAPALKGKGDTDRAGVPGSGPDAE